MPKGDRLKLKADPEDGTTPIANLLLEAVACAKLSGTEKGAILFLWRQTYGWVIEGKRLKEKEVSQYTLTKFLGINSKTAFNILKSLTDKNIFLREFIGAGKGYVYKMNTDITKWNTGCIDLDLLRLYTIGDKTTGNNTYGHKTVGEITIGDKNISKDNLDSQGLTGLVSQEPPHLPSQVQPQDYLYNKEILNKDKEIKVDKSTFGKKINETLLELEKLRGYKATKREAEAASIKRMLSKNYSNEQILNTWKELKEKPYHQKQELFMMTIESQIGAVVHGKQQSSKPQGVTIRN